MPSEVDDAAATRPRRRWVRVPLAAMDTPTADPPAGSRSVASVAGGEERRRLRELAAPVDAAAATELAGDVGDDVADNVNPDAADDDDDDNDDADGEAKVGW